MNRLLGRVLQVLATHTSICAHHAHWSTEPAEVSIACREPGLSHVAASTQETE
eukprot:CAMPEP_0183455076 /NCGR_PEP_ID=MMETSP0370-20130417/125741_1 /TAXON_ID=268820 /ORGANISM="Peridinium aciculiferum, Strain PAER-2" /LENGTH=52 /DNA_ID=CAMNT_0025646641 /DNA_START=605 /DNA_END=760 /DNA_ORIENTATION=-